MKKILALVLALTMVLSLSAIAFADDEEMSVAMITDYGDITDQSFNQTTYEACKAYADENDVAFQYYKPTGDSTAERVASIEQAIDEGYNVIVMPGYAFGGAVAEITADYDDIKFIALDVGAGDILEAALGEDYDYTPENWDVTEYYNTANTYCATYQEQLCGYMAGYAAVKLGYTKLGFCGGMAVPAVMRYGYGFVQGADAAAAEIGAEGVEIKYAYANQFSGDADITAYMDTWYNDGTEVVFACGGGVYTSVAEAAAKVEAKVIGVDVDQAALIDGQYGEGMTVTSAMKGLAPTVQLLLAAVQDGLFEEYAGKIDSLGLVSEVPEENYVQLGTTQFEDGKFTEEDYNALVAAMFNGEIEVSSDVSAEPEVSAVAVDYQGNIK